MAPNRPVEESTGVHQTTQDMPCPPCIKRREFGGEGWIRTIEGISQQIYSLPRLAASVPLPDPGELRIVNGKMVAAFDNQQSEIPVCSPRWSGRWESNPPHQLGRLAHYHYATPASHAPTTIWPWKSLTPARYNSGPAPSRASSRPSLHSVVPRREGHILGTCQQSGGGLRVSPVGLSVQRDRFWG
jgi:hypothetical protein